MRGKHDFIKLGDRLARELGRITGQDKQAEEARNAIRNRYLWYHLQAGIDEMEASPGRFCIVPIDMEILIDPRLEACGTLVELLCNNIQQARVMACRIAEHSRQSWKLYRGRKWIDTILYSAEIHHAVAVEASLTAIARDLFDGMLKEGSEGNHSNQGKTHGHH